MLARYLSLSLNEFKDKIDKLYDLLTSCTLCPNNCKVNRINKERGFCRVGNRPYISSYGAHFGEEPPITGYRGSGTIFFTYCNLRCIYCQNYSISQLGEGKEIDILSLSDIMLNLQKQGCHNINLVTPTHQIPFIIEAVYIASKKGLSIPLVYNSGGYESLSTLKILDGVVDIYMPDFKYFDNKIAEELSGIKNYVDVSKIAIKEMHRQVGDLVINDGIALRGVLIRHLVLPENISGSDELLKFIAEDISLETYINIMDQYYPCFRAATFPPLDRRITKKELSNVLEMAKKIGFKRIYY